MVGDNNDHRQNWDMPGIRPSNQQLLSQILPSSEMKLKVNIKMLFLSEENAAVMDTQVVKQTLHQLIDQIEDKELLTIYLRLLERELKKTSDKDFFDTSDEDLVARAKASLQSIEKGRARSIQDFKQDVETWKKNRATP